MVITKQELERVVSRNTHEVAQAMLDRRLLVAFEGYEHAHALAVKGENVITIMYRAVFNDMIAHAIKVLDTDERSRTFWSLLEFESAKVRDLKSYSDHKIRFLERLAEKLRIVRNKTHFHLDQLGIMDSRKVWADADIKGNEFGEGLGYLWEILSELHRQVLGKDFPDVVNTYDGRDVVDLLEHACSRGLIHTYDRSAGDQHS